MKRAISAENNFTYLTVALLLLLLAGAVVDQFFGGAGEGFLEAATVLSLAVGVWSIRSERLWFHTGIGLVAGLLSVAGAIMLLDIAGLQYIHLAIMLVFFIFTVWLAARQVLFSGQIDVNEIVGAFCIFLLLGMIWAILYLLLAELAPASFYGLRTGAWQSNFSDLVYFSFISLTSMGYGDITPALPLARFLAYLEAVMGQFYIAVLVASLVGRRVSGNRKG